MAGKLTMKEVDAKRKNIDNLPKILAVVNPDKYAKDSETKKAIKEKVKESPYLALDVASGKADEEHQIIYDASSETLEPIYFWILDMMNGMFGGKVKKIIDNFTSTVGSSHFSETQGKATRMQEEGMKIMGTVAGVVKGIINLVYDLKDFEIRLSHYEAAKSKEDLKSRSGMLSLKQIWLDQVDFKRGNTGLKAMTAQMGFVGLVDYFLSVDSVEGARGMDTTENIKKIIEQRIYEFLKWKELSEEELKKRYSVEKAYLKNQVNSLKMYTRWAKPYLRAASQLEMKNYDDPALVNAFNTMIMQLTIMGQKEFDVKDAVYQGRLRPNFPKDKIKRKYYPCVIIDFKFRGIPDGLPQRAGSAYIMRGRTDITFRSYCLSDEELKLFNRMIDETDINEALALAEGMTTESLEAIRKDLEYFLGEKIGTDGTSPGGVEGEKKPEKTKGFFDDFNPFKDIKSMFGVESKKSEEVEFGKIKPDNHYEEEIRKMACNDAKATCFKIFNTYKKGHGMPAHKDPYD
ncbi:MAG: hypothetical protein AABW73_04580 [Nanoarchaeota archaeon]